MTLPYPPIIILPLEPGLAKMLTEEPFASHPEFEISVRKYCEFGYRHQLLGWIKVLMSELVRPALEWKLLDMELKAKQNGSDF